MNKRLSAAECACLRQATGYTQAEMARLLVVNPRTMRAWESGRDLVPEWVGPQLQAMAAEVQERVDLLLAAGGGLVAHDDHAGRLAAGIALVEDPDVSIEWDDPAL